MNPSRFPVTLQLIAIWAMVLSPLQGQQDAGLERIVDQFGAIESRLSSMQVLEVDASHADSHYGVGQLTIWMDGDTVVKVKNELFVDDNRSIQEGWMVDGQLIFFFERSEWHGNQDGTVNINEYRHYLDNGQAIREMNRSAIRPKGSDLDITSEPHRINNEFDAEYGKSFYEDKRLQTAELIKTARALSSPSGYRLPTEAEWEYACRAESIRAFGDDPREIGEIAGYSGAVETATRKPNAFGLFDMQGNVWEWCHDFYSPGYDGLTSHDPRGAAASSTRVFRGGSWMEEHEAARPSARGYGLPDFRHRTVGFRVALAKE